jgi:predicted N-acyltransferase
VPLRKIKNTADALHLVIGEYDGELRESVSGFSESDWDSCITEEKIFLTRSYLSVCERSNLPGLSNRFLMLRKNGSPCAVAYFQLINLSDAGLGGILNLEEYGGLAGTVSGKINKLLFNPGSGNSSFLLVCGNLLISGNHGISAIDTDSFLAAVKSITSVKKAIEQSLARTEKIVGFMVKDFYVDEDKIASPVFSKDYFMLNTDPEMIFDVNPEWNNFEDYLAALSSKYRVRTKAAMAKMEGIVVRELSFEDVKLAINDLYTLNDNVIRKAPVKLIRPSADYFIQLKQMYGDHFRIKGFYLGNKMIAFTSALWNKHHMEAHCIGLDYSLNSQYSIYQNILYSYIDDAIECKSKRLYFGRTALEIKSTTGAKPFHLTCYFRFANRMLNLLAKPMISSTGPGNWIPRDPFRSK